VLSLNSIGNYRRRFRNHIISGFSLTTTALSIFEIIRDTNDFFPSETVE